jgi:circadian clock protein KaiC
MNKDSAELYASSGIPGLDNILRGGFPRDCMLLIAGTPAPARRRSRFSFFSKESSETKTCLYVTLSETRAELEKVAKSHGWDLSRIHITELVPSERNLSADSLLTVFSPSELELGETTQALIAAANQYRPKRLVIDSLAELRLIAQNPIRYRRQVLALKQYFSGRDCTVLLLDDRTGGNESDQVQTVAHGVIVLEQLASQFGAERRRLRVSKMRGVPFRGGYHDLTIRTGGLDVYPRLVASEHPQSFIEHELPSANEQLDTLLGGGLPAGTSTLLLGPAGTGKSTVATQFATAAAARGERPRCSSSTRTSARSGRDRESSACPWIRRSAKGQSRYSRSTRPSFRLESSLPSCARWCKAATAPANRRSSSSSTASTDI